MSIGLKAVLFGAAWSFASLSVVEAAETIPLTTYLGQWAVTARVGGHDETFTFDTGGGLTMIQPPIAAAIGCKPWGQVTGFRMRGDRIDSQRCDDFTVEINGMKVISPTAGVWDMSKLLPPDAPPLAGNIALDMFAGKVLTLDFVKRQIVIETPKSLTVRIKEAREVPVHFAREVGGLALVPYVPVETSVGRLWVELDCGSDASFMLGRHAAALLGLDPDKKGGQPVTFTLGGGLVVQTKATIGDYIIDGDIGAPAMKAWVVTLDLAHQRLWVKTGS